MKKFLEAGLALSLLGACGGSDDQPPLSLRDQQEHFTESVEMAATEPGQPVSIDKRVPCNFDLLIGSLVVQKDLGPGVAVVADAQTGEVPEFGLVQCFDTDSGERIIRGNDGW